MGQTQAFADAFASMLRSMWRRWCDDLPPATLGLSGATEPDPLGTPAAPPAQQQETLLALLEQGQMEQAEALATALCQQFPHNRLAWTILAQIYQNQERFDVAVPALQGAIAADPADAVLRNNLGVVLLSLGRLDAAEATLRQAHALNPAYHKALVNLATALRLQGRSDEAQTLCRQVLDADASDASAWVQLGNALEAQGRASQAQACYYKADMAHEPRRAVAHSNVLYLMNHDVLVEPQHLIEEHLAFGEAFEAPLRAQWTAHTNSKEALRPLKIGFVCGDFCDHALTPFLEPAFKALSTRPLLELHAYSTRVEEDETTQRLRWYFGRWSQVASLSNEQLAEKIRADGIDILVDLSGHTARNRLLTFALKPAPVQVGWIGYLGTSGLQAMDYYLCDELWLPQEQHAWQFTEQLAYLPSSVVFSPDPSAPALNALPALANGYVTFGSFNRISKINDAVIALWSMLMQRVPESRLLLGGIAPERHAALSDTFAAHGIDAARLTFMPRLEPAGYLALHHQVDCCLDTYPHGGGATTAHAAWMGVPTLSLAGETPASRFGASLLRHLGLGHCVTSDIEAFVQAGVALCSDLEQLGALRAELRSRFVQSPLGQVQHFTRSLESSLRAMWKRWCDGLPAAAMDCAPEDDSAPAVTALTVVSASKRSAAEFWASSALGQSIQQHMERDPRIRICVAFENSRGLSEIFNGQIAQAADDAVLVFMHDDVWIDEPYFVDTVLAGLAQFDVIGVAGNRRRVRNQPAWPFVNLQFTWDDQRHLSGRVGHGPQAHAPVTNFGATPAPCVLLDGVLMACRSATLKKNAVQFDCAFDFHFYDLDFCRSAAQANLSIGTWPLAITHQSPGAYSSSRWQELYAVYQQKWPEPQASAAPEHLRFFIGHKPPDFGLWPGFTYCSQKGGDFVLPHDRELDELTSDVLSEYHSLFLLRRQLLAQGVSEGNITICQHRRFVLNLPLGDAAVNLPSSRTIEAPVAAALDTALLAPREGHFLIASPMHLDHTVLDQFHLHHPLRDMLRFYSDLLDAKLLSAADVHSILTMKMLIPAPSCGTVTVQAFMEIYGLLEKCVAAWHAGGYQPREGYQRRITGFLLERLHGYLLICHLINAGLEVEQTIGYTTVVSEGNRILPGQ
jgi:predicted O-linked N-acetylglucosamine transferase (SPINDLY family)